MTRFDDFVSSFTHLISSHPFTSEKREEEEEEEEERGLELEREFLREGAVILEKLVSFLPHNSHPPGIDWLPGLFFFFFFLFFVFCFSFFFCLTLSNGIEFYIFKSKERKIQKNKKKGNKNYKN